MTIRLGIELTGKIHDCLYFLAEISRADYKLALVQTIPYRESPRGLLHLCKYP